MGLFDFFSSAIKSGAGRAKLFDLEREYINLILNSEKGKNKELNESLLNLFFRMSNVAWLETSAQLFYAQNGISVELFRQAYVSASFSLNNNFIKSKNALLSNLVMVDDPERYSTYLTAIFESAKNNEGVVDKSVVDFMLQIAMKNY